MEQEIRELTEEEIGLIAGGQLTVLEGGQAAFPIHQLLEINGQWVRVTTVFNNGQDGPLVKINRPGNHILILNK